MGTTNETNFIIASAAGPFQKSYTHIMNKQNVGQYSFTVHWYVFDYFGDGYNICGGNNICGYYVAVDNKTIIESNDEWFEEKEHVFDVILLTKPPSTSNSPTSTPSITATSTSTSFSPISNPTSTTTSINPTSTPITPTSTPSNSPTSTPSFALTSSSMQFNMVGDMVNLMLQMVGVVPQMLEMMNNLI